MNCTCASTAAQTAALPDRAASHWTSALWSSPSALVQSDMIGAGVTAPDRKVKGITAGGLMAAAGRVAVTSCCAPLLSQLITACRFDVTVKAAVLTSWAV